MDFACFPIQLLSEKICSFSDKNKPHFTLISIGFGLVVLLWMMNAAVRPDGSQRAAVTNAQTRPHKRWSRLRGVFWLQAGIELFGFLWTHHSYVGNVWSARLVWRILGWWWRNITRRRCCGRRGFCGHGWRILRRGRGICDWRGSRTFAPFP